MRVGKIAATTVYIAAVAAVSFWVRGCCSPKGQMQLVATVIDGPTHQIIPNPGFGGAAKYATCDVYYGGGAGGGGQTKGPCQSWVVYSEDAGGQITVNATGYQQQTYDVPPADTSACGQPDRPTKTFAMVRSPSM